MILLATDMTVQMFLGKKRSSLRAQEIKGSGRQEEKITSGSAIKGVGDSIKCNG